MPGTAGCLDQSPCCTRAARPARGSWPGLQGLEQGVVGILSLASRRLEAAAILWPYPLLLGQEEGGERRTRTAQFLYMWGHNI